VVVEPAAVQAVVAAAVLPAQAQAEAKQWRIGGRKL
jgi:hypothetical protein